ncbi:hypothetical protein [Streptomyces nymphaeiformis]|uniref:Uncharacterized protein n=1 Tax=Streptomyces nymphaeiformis TaxID=2663842 RepID=A0A7W7TX27_9ACTN|nr:hypothetical protein [Streptomyces nymphaeiformis]MBB4980954.1 hypothetical protein [Streptomyces nymphaeiformis]
MVGLLTDAVPVQVGQPALRTEPGTGTEAVRTAATRARDPGPDQRVLLRVDPQQAPGRPRPVSPGWSPSTNGASGRVAVEGDGPCRFAITGLEIGPAVST